MAGQRQQQETRGNRQREGTGPRGRSTCRHFCVVVTLMLVEGKKVIHLRSCQFRNMNRRCVDLGWACWTCKQRKFDEEYLPNGYFVGVIKCKFDVILCTSHIQLTILPEDYNELSTI